MIDELSTLAGEYFASIAVVAGSGYKLEANLARFYVPRSGSVGSATADEHLP